MHSVTVLVRYSAQGDDVEISEAAQVGKTFDKSKFRPSRDSVLLEVEKISIYSGNEGLRTEREL